MRLKRLKLRNIRSYLNQEINFPQGSVLLAGDIGTGKSTVLLAIEFALFGIKAGELPGNALLRHGKKEGSVELTFSLGKKEVLVKRFLKKTKNGVSQDAGYLVVDGIKKDATPKELRSLVFELLGYPKELVSKSKDLIYRYTVYTPQDLMKDILHEHPEERLDTLRRVFNMDKYKRVRENSKIILAHLREEKKELEGLSHNLAERKKEHAQIGDQRKILEEKLKKLQPELILLQEAVAQRALNLEKQEKKMKTYHDRVRELKVVEARFLSILEQRKQNTLRGERLQQEIDQLQKEVSGKAEAIKDFSPLIKEKSTFLVQSEQALRSLHQQIHAAQTKKELSEDTKKKVLQLQDCPLCKQQVSHTHKESITQEEDKKVDQFLLTITEARKKEKLLSHNMESTKKEVEELRQKQHEADLINLKLKNLDDRKEEQKRLCQGQDDMKKEIGALNIKKKELHESITSYEGVEKEYQVLREKLEKARQEERTIAIETASVKKEVEGLDTLQATFERDIHQKEQAAGTLKKVGEAQQWLQDYFTKLMFTIEKHVMVQINKEFNELFKNWFSILMEDETINVRLDDEFSPILEQNGYETFIRNLSGGEKTSVALSYRLALNKVVNDIIGEIKTKDLLVLDEPTDGFSTEQLDKIREVLDLVNVSQVIVVSHEAKIESFVDHVLRVGKQDHASTVMH